MSWETVPICSKCWMLEEPDRQPVVLKASPPETCYACDRETQNGIFVRRQVSS